MPPEALLIAGLFAITWLALLTVDMRGARTRHVHPQYLDIFRWSGDRKRLDAVIHRLGERVDRSDAEAAGFCRDIAELRAGLASHQHPHEHDHPFHVHWCRKNSTEVTDGVRRDVYVCIMPDCKAIIAHTPEE